MYCTVYVLPLKKLPPNGFSGILLQSVTDSLPSQPHSNRHK